MKFPLFVLAHNVSQVDCLLQTRICVWLRAFTHIYTSLARSDTHTFKFVVHTRFSNTTSAKTL